MRRGLVGHDVRARPAGFGAAHQFRNDVCCVAAQADGHDLFAIGVQSDELQRLIERGRLLIQVAGAQAKVDAALLALNIERAGPGKSSGQWLRTAHAAQPGREDPAPGQRAAKVLASGLHKGFVSALHNALRADVNPATGGHLAVHHQAGAIQLVEVFPVGPLRYQVGIGQQHAWCLGVGAKHAYRLTALHQQGFVFFELAQTIQNAFKTRPVARRFADAAIDHQLVRVFGHFRVQVVLDHAVGRFDLPVGTRKRRATRSAHRAGLGVGEGGQGGLGDRCVHDAWFSCKAHLRVCQDSVVVYTTCTIGGKP